MTSTPDTPASAAAPSGPAAVPYVISYPPELPVSARRDDLLAAVRENQVVIVAGETGSGKTTQLPKILLEAGCEHIGHTQPRRIAARSIAERLSDELGVELGTVVGYQVRFTDQTSASTRVKLMTDGVLLAEINRDRDLKRYDAIIIDEAHERSLTIDFLLGYLTRLLPRRPDLKVVITSATIDPESFARHFADAQGEPAPIVEVSGRTFPVEIRYRPLVADGGVGADDDEDDDDRSGAAAASGADGGRDQTDGILDALAELDREPAGDVLVFLSGEAEIRDAEDAVRGRYREASGTEVLPLYGRLSAADQHRVFGARPAGVRRRVVLSTNVAETSLTVPGIKYVIDAGTARISRYSPRAKVQRLPIEAISQASANQRSGRAGRTSDGIAIRLYSEEDFARRPEFTDPEILRTGLAAVILQMISLDLGDIDAFPFLQPPDSRGIADGLDLLAELGAVRAAREGDGARGGSGSGAASGARQITRIGRELSRLPVDPRFGRMLVEGRRLGVAREVTAIVAGLSIQDVRERPLEKRPQADQSHARFRDPSSDFVSMLNLWNHLQREQKDRSGNAFRRMCRDEFLNYLRVREWQDLNRQILRALDLKGSEGSRADGGGRGRGRGRGRDAERRDAPGRDAPGRDVRGRGRADATAANTSPSAAAGSTVAERSGAAGSGASTADAGATGADADAIHRALLSGLLSRIGIRDDRTSGSNAGGRDKRDGGRDEESNRSRRGREFLGARGQRFTVFPGSALSSKPPAAVMAAELVETSRLFARTVAAIDPAWAEALAGDLVKRSHADPHWEKRQGAAVVNERVTLYGVVIVPRRRVQLARIDRAYARELLIRHAFVGGEWPNEIARDRLFDFDRDNRRLRRELAEVEERTRRRDILLDDEAVVDFYDARLPREVATVREFESWWREERKQSPELLTMTRADLLPDDEPDVDESLYPSEWRSDDQRLALRYRFEPGADDDGVTVDVPLALLPGVQSDGFDWLVPGMREELVTALIKTLPKAIRRNVVPAGDWARRLVAELPAQPDGRLTERLAELIRRLAHTPVSPDDFDPARLPEHLRVNYSAVDERGRRVRRSKSLDELKSSLGERARTSVAKAATTPRSDLERTGLTTFDLDELPAVLDTKQGGNTIRAYPALVDEGPGSVAVKLFGTEGEATAAHAGGIRRLLALALPSPLSYVQEHLTGPEKMALATSPYRSTAALLDDALAAAIDERIGDRAPRTRAEFDALRDEVSAGLLDAVFGVVSTAAAVLDAARAADKAISKNSSLAFMSPLADARAQLAALAHPGFIGATGATQLRRVPIYLRGIAARVDALVQNPGRDRVWQNEVENATALYREAGGALPLAPGTSARLRAVRWMLEELRLSLFAQQLGAAGPISIQRIRKALAER
ncbi:ATP-dependent RNA helicase HrpA [Schumannella sp. 10F1B-5-1]|uniref:ATP-dependent RNA helicase HrpA n=1 Tax=Schumannella sp. 10F1B-5-1 TaxID=2590780 RepID=UPI0011307424|nr:ATP-dependent RNA helicase HrpA [Schumannella sp. 10F1B-5-1]TPW72974.1 ATP-dependent RNA helicase HrpA [Schumannella sp. 10F1B-5-1]